VTFSDYKLERVGFSLLLCIALLMFFQPLVRLHRHDGSQTINALNIRYETSQLQSDLRILGTIKDPTDSGASLGSSAAPIAVKPMPIPFSLRMASLVPWFVFGALGFCLLALLDHLFLQKAVATLSLVGACAGAIAVLHMMLMDSDLRSWTDILINTALLSYSDDPSGAIRMATSFLVSPGFGLYVLTACLFLLPILSFTRAVPRVRSVARRGRRIKVSQPVSLRPVNSRYPEENCTSVNVSEGGLLLETSLNHYYVGMEVYLTRNVRAGGPRNPEEHGSVVRVERAQSGKCRIAIRIIPEA